MTDTIFTGYGEHAYGSLAYGGGTALASTAFQFESVIANAPAEVGVEFGSITSSLPDSQGFQFFATNLGFNCPGYGLIDYGALGYGGYGVMQCRASGAVQFDKEGSDVKAIGVQFFSVVDDFVGDHGTQFESIIPDAHNFQGLQFDSIEIDFPDNNGIQYEVQIVDALNTQGIQFESTVFAEVPVGFQFDTVSAKSSGFQYTISLYNTNRLRILCDFPSRGASEEGSNNAWGRASGTGLNWETSSQMAGDFEVFRLNTDIVEEVFRTNNTITGLTLDCDTEVAQGVFLDTLAILNHNLTTSAQITLIGSVNSSFSPIGVTQPIASRDTNIFHIEAELPLTSFRYWRLAIEDATNTSPYLEIGTIVFGSAVILNGECMLQTVSKTTRHFADSVRTEGFTSVKNDRSIKDAVTITFEKLEFDKGNFQNLNQIFRTARTSLKCLWIPSPSPTNPSFTERFAVFAKMVSIPQQTHTVMGPDEGDFIDLVVELDEAE